MKQNQHSKKQWISHAADRYRAWQELLDFSTRLALAGMQAQGCSDRQAWQIWRRRWEKSSREHQQANRRIAQRLRASDEKPSPSAPR